MVMPITREYPRGLRRTPAARTRDGEATETMNSYDYNKGFDQGYRMAQMESERVRESLAAWRPLHYVCLGVLLGYLLAWLA